MDGAGDAGGRGAQALLSPEDPGSASSCCHPRSIPSCLPAGVWLPSPSHPIPSHPASSCSIPSHTAPAVAPQRGEPQTPPGAGGLPAALGWRSPPGSIPCGASAASPAPRPALGARSGRGRARSRCWVSAEPRVPLPGGSGGRPSRSLLLAVCFICKLPPQIAAGAAGPCAGSGDASRGHGWPWGHPAEDRCLPGCRPPKKPQIPVGCWQ